MVQREVSRFQAVVGLTLFATLALPITAGGPSLLDLLLGSFHDNPFGALLLLVMLGSPQLFGLAVAFAGLMSGERGTARWLVTALVTLMQGMLVMFATKLIGTRLLAPAALLGFALVTGLYLPFAAGQAEASPRGQLSLRWYVRWGALLIAGLGGWVRVQLIDVVTPALDVALLSAALLLASTARREPAAPLEG